MWIHTEMYTWHDKNIQSPLWLSCMPFCYIHDRLPSKKECLPPQALLFKKLSNMNLQGKLFVPEVHK